MTETERTTTRICRGCGKPMEVPEIDMGGMLAEFMKAIQDAVVCDDCARKSMDRFRTEEERQRLVLLPDWLQECGVPEEMSRLEKAPNANVAMWIWEHRSENFVLSGGTGAGKTTGACYMLRRLMMKLNHPKSIRYATLSELGDEWRRARSAEYTGRTQRCMEYEFLKGLLADNDILVIDEISGKAKWSESLADMMFRIIDWAYSGRAKARVWMLGNVSSTSISRMFAESDTVARRLFEKFASGVVQKDGRVASAR